MCSITWSTAIFHPWGWVWLVALEASIDGMSFVYPFTLHGTIFIRSSPCRLAANLTLSPRFTMNLTPANVGAEDFPFGFNGVFTDLAFRPFP